MRFLFIASLLVLSTVVHAQDTGFGGRAPILTVNGSGFGAPSCSQIIRKRPLDPMLVTGAKEG